MAHTCDPHLVLPFRFFRSLMVNSHTTSSAGEARKYCEYFRLAICFQFVPPAHGYISCDPLGQMIHFRISGISESDLSFENNCRVCTGFPDETAFPLNGTSMRMHKLLIFSCLEFQIKRDLTEVWVSMPLMPIHQYTCISLFSVGL